jgi:hypothetical protein
MDFLDKMKGKVVGASQKLREGVDHVVAEASDKLQENRLRAQLKALQGDKLEKLQALGSKVFELHRGDGIGLEDLQADLAGLDQLELEITAKQQELEDFLTPPG